MKQNKMMRLASGLLVAVLLTSSIVSGTFAKYTTSASSIDAARVARWGFDATTINITDLFATSYNNVTSVGGDVIAPGTEGSSTIWFTTESGAAPEVAYKFEVVAESEADNDDTNTIIGNPNIKWAFYKDGQATTATWGTFGQMLTKINEMSEAEVEENNLPELSGKYVVAWKWIFDETATNVEADTQNNDVNDTLMGNADTLEAIDLTITITATQLD